MIGKLDFLRLPANNIPMTTVIARESHMSNSAELIQGYVDASKDVRAAFGGMSQEHLRARPVPGKWSAMEVLCHLVDTDLMTAGRIRSALTSSTPRLPGLPIEQLTAMLAVDGRDAQEELEYFTLIRNETARILRALPSDALQRTAMLIKANGEEVTKTVEQFVSGITSHVAHHLQFVHEKRRILGISAH
jgi:uncharacterized damage-inducible protein DinB